MRAYCIYVRILRIYARIYAYMRDSAGSLNFFSISSDGRVSNWKLMKNKLESEEVMELKLMSGTGGGEDDQTSLAGLAGGLC